MRESPTFKLLDFLKAGGAHVAYYDPYVPIIGPTREHAEWKGEKSIKWNRKTIAAFDLISTAHKSVNYQELADWAELIVDTRNAMASVKTKPGQVWKA